MRQEEFFGLYKELDSLQFRPRIRNPDPITWAAKTVHEILVSIGPEATAVGSFAVKKAYDILAKLVEQKLKERNDGNVEVAIYGPDGRPVSTVTRKPDRPKRKG